MARYKHLRRVADQPQYVKQGYTPRHRSQQYGGPHQVLIRAARISAEARAALEAEEN